MRTCHPCQECCEFYDVVELNKPARQRCPHQCESGCAIHDQPRCDTCEKFTCGWVRGVLPEELRPDKAKIIVVKKGHVHVGRKGGTFYRGVRKPGDRDFLEVDLVDSYAYMRRDVEKWIKRQRAIGNVLLLISRTAGILRCVAPDNYHLTADIAYKALSELEAEDLERVRQFRATLA
jgi:hypothetical protein